MAAPLFVAVSIILRTVAYRGKTKPPTEEGRGKRERGSFLAANNTRAGLLRPLANRLWALVSYDKK